MAKIMLVEDDNNLREIYEARLVAEGYEVVAARDGEEALAMAGKERPQLVISDVMMPKISGFEMLDILRNTEGLQDVKVIMLTALGQAEDKTRADSLGADRYLVKSQVTLEDIVNAAHALLDDTTAAPTAPAAKPEPVVEAPAPVSTPAAEPVAVAVEPAPAPAPEAPAAAEPTTPAVETAPEASADVPEPVAPPTEPTATTPGDAPSEPQAQGIADEEAVMQSQIDDFLSHQSADAPTEVEPTSAPTPEAPAALESVTPATPEPATEVPAPASEPATEPTPPTEDETPEAEGAMGALEVNQQPQVAVSEAPVAPVAEEPEQSADAAMESAAIDELVSSTAAETAPAPAPVAPEPTEPTPPVTPTPSTTPGNVPIAGKKVITPITPQQTKPDINALLAMEEAKAAAQQAASAAAAPTVMPAPAPAPMPAPQPPTTPAGPHPNDIAL